MAVLDSSKSTERRDSETEAARQRFLNSTKHPAWLAADAAAPDVIKGGRKMNTTPEEAWTELNEHGKRVFNRPEGSTCPVCNGSGHLLSVWSNPEYYHGLLTICPECGSVRTKKDAARSAGNPPVFGDFIDSADWRRNLHLKACSFAQHPAGVFYIGGQTATGKSHLCSKIYYHLIANGSSGLMFQPWKSFVRRSSKDWQLIDTAKGCNILWLDGFLDTVSSRGTPTAAELDKALEVLDARIAGRKITIISSCWTPERLEDIAPQIASRIEQSSGNGQYFLEVPDGKINRWKAVNTAESAHF